jgi:murein peptide amidase A
VSYYSVDNAGNAETPKTCSVKIDTTGPVTELTTSGGVAGVAFTFSCRVSDDLSASASSVRLTITNSHGRVVKILAWTSAPIATRLTARWKPISQDTYGLRLTARDEAGNAQVLAATRKVFAGGPWWRTIGRSVQGRAIVATRFGSGARRVLYVGGMHGNECGTAVAKQFVSHLVSHPKAVPAGARIVVVRCVNPDGLAHGTRGNARGVDLNRNLPTRDWRRRVNPASEPAGVLLTGGSSPGSEPETKALLALLKNGDFRAVVSLHSRAGILICEGPRSRDLGRRMESLCDLPVGRLSYESAITGSLGTFVPERYGIPIVTVELRSATLFSGLASALVSVAR